MMHKSKYGLVLEYIKSFFLPDDSLHDETARQILGYREWRLPQDKDLFHSVGLRFGIHSTQI